MDMSIATDNTSREGADVIDVVADGAHGGIVRQQHVQQGHESIEELTNHATTVGCGK